MADVVMPRLSDSMEEGTILRWLKQVGDEVAVGEELVEIETDKANMAYETDVAGTLTEILAAGGRRRCRSATSIARVGDAGEGSERVGRGSWRGGSRGACGRGAPRRGPAAATPPAEAAAPRRQPAAAPGRAPPSGAGRAVKASPLARRMAEEQGRRPGAALQGSGPGGRIVKADVERRPRPRVARTRGRRGTDAARPPAGPPGGRAGVRPASRPPRARSATRSSSKLQPTVARRMAESKATAPHFYLRGRDRHEPRRSRRGRRSRRRPARARSCPPSTTWWSRPARWRCASSRAPTAPTATAASSSTRGSTSASRSPPQDALVVPTVFDADRKGLRQIAAESRALAQRVRDGTITPPELSGGDLHRLQPGHVRDRQLRRRDQPAAGGDPRRRRDHASAPSSATARSSPPT